MFKIIENIINIYKNNSFLLIISLMSLVIIIIAKLFYNNFRGYMGECWLKKELNKLPKKNYKVLNNIMISSNNMTYQIDHLVISHYGIFVIEMKNYYGKIYGNEYKKYWYQYVNGNKRLFYNPIYQNYGHIKALSNILNKTEDIFISIVCFSNQSKLNIKSENIVTQLDYVKDIILKYNDKILINEIDKIKKTIEIFNIKDKKIRKDHIKKIKEKIN